MSALITLFSVRLKFPVDDYQVSSHWAWSNWGTVFCGTTWAQRMRETSVPWASFSKDLICFAVNHRRSHHRFNLNTKYFEWKNSIYNYLTNVMNIDASSVIYFISCHNILLSPRKWPIKWGFRSISQPLSQSLLDVSQWANMKAAYLQ